MLEDVELLPLTLCSISQEILHWGCFVGIGEVVESVMKDGGVEEEGEVDIEPEAD